MSAPALQERALALVEEGFRTLPERYLGAPKGFDATYHVRLGDVGHTWEVRCTEHGARVRKGITAPPADVVIGTDAETWLRLRAGRADAPSRRSASARSTRAASSTSPCASRASSGSPTAATR